VKSIVVVMVAASVIAVVDVQVVMLVALDYLRFEFSRTMLLYHCLDHYCYYPLMLLHKLL
jgi:hypothetical protein